MCVVLYVSLTAANVQTTTSIEMYIIAWDVDL